MTLGMWLSLAGGIFQLIAIGIATVSAVLAYQKVRARVRIIRESSERHRDDPEKAAEYRRGRGVEPDMTWGYVPFVRTLITEAISRSAARSALATVFFLAAGVVLSTAASLVDTNS
ncbi:hypothetical protein [Micromonospora sp. SL4-19]|uniref:hypothetical protein n=1 Tax=Micromonospora sp. SL4-19 TaxID=3399129 RepID=UPI003A4D3975